MHSEKDTIGGVCVKGVFIVHVKMVEEVTYKFMGGSILIGGECAVDSCTVFIEANKNNRHGLMFFSLGLISIL